MSSHSSFHNEVSGDAKPSLGSVTGAALLAVVAWEAYASYLSIKKPIFPVQGSVFCENEPAVGAQVTFHSLDTEQSWTQPPAAVVAEDGSFALSTLGIRRGAPAGEYAVTIEWRPREIQGEEFRPGNNLLAAEYSDSQRSPLRVVIEPFENQLPRWLLKKCDCSR